LYREFKASLGYDTLSQKKKKKKRRKTRGRDKKITSLKVALKLTLSGIDA
jgi:hypothetical protein